MCIFGNNLADFRKFHKEGGDESEMWPPATTPVNHSAISCSKKYFHISNGFGDLE